MSTKDIRDLSDYISEKKRNEEIRLKTEKKNEYSSIAADGIVEKKMANAENVRKTGIGRNLSERLVLVKVILLSVLAAILLFQAYRLFFTRTDNKSTFAPYKPSYVQMDEKNSAEPIRFLDEVISAFEKDGSKEIEGFWDEKIPPFVIAVSTGKLAKLKEMGDASFREGLYEETMSSYTAYYGGTGKTGIVFRIVKKKDGTFRLTGIE